MTRDYHAKLTSVTLDGFKGFEHASVSLGGFSVIVGTNGSGKSNLFDAMRFLHGISRGYTIAEALGEKWSIGGSLDWEGIRGGTREVTFCGTDRFAIEVGISIGRRVIRACGKETYDADEGLEIGDVAADDGTGNELSCAGCREDFSYRLEVKRDFNGSFVVASEKLVNENTGQFVFDTHPPDDPLGQTADPNYFAIRTNLGPKTNGMKPSDVLTVEAARPFLAVWGNPAHAGPVGRSALTVFALLPPSVQGVLLAIQSMRFFELLPDALRTPSTPGHMLLSDCGANLSSVLQGICADEQKRAALCHWITALTPMDVVDFEFIDDASGRVVFTLVDRKGDRISSNSASGGTLRLLALLSIFITDEPPSMCFFEDVDAGFHPTRLHLLTGLIENRARDGETQVIATTHSPQILAFLSKQAVEDAVIAYRLESDRSQSLRKLCEIPDARRLVSEGSLARLFSSGWFESTILFLQDSDESCEM